VKDEPEAESPDRQRQRLIHDTARYAELKDVRFVKVAGELFDEEGAPGDELTIELGKALRIRGKEFHCRYSADIPLVSDDGRELARI
jgi:hypothetical protein